MKQEELFEMLPPIAVDFLNYYSVIKNRSDLTITEYANDLLTFFRFLKIENGLEDKYMPFEKIDVKDVTESLISNVTLITVRSAELRRRCRLNAATRQIRVRHGIFQENP